MKNNKNSLNPSITNKFFICLKTIWLIVESLMLAFLMWRAISNNIIDTNRFIVLLRYYCRKSLEPHIKVFSYLNFSFYLILILYFTWQVRSLYKYNFIITFFPSFSYLVFSMMCNVSIISICLNSGQKWCVENFEMDFKRLAAITCTNFPFFIELLYNFKQKTLGLININHRWI